MVEENVIKEEYGFIVLDEDEEPICPICGQRITEECPVCGEGAWFDLIIKKFSDGREIAIILCSNCGNLIHECK